MNSQGKPTVEAVDAIDLEEHAQAGKKPPANRTYRIRVDEARFVVDSPITGLGILQLTGASPEKHYVTMRLRGGRPPVREIGLNEPVDLTEPGIERFFVRSRQSQPG